MLPNPGANLCCRFEADSSTDLIKGTVSLPSMEKKRMLISFVAALPKSPMHTKPRMIVPKLSLNVFKTALDPWDLQLNSLLIMLLCTVDGALLVTSEIPGHPFGKLRLSTNTKTTLKISIPTLLWIELVAMCVLCYVLSSVSQSYCRLQSLLCNGTKTPYIMLATGMVSDISLDLVSILLSASVFSL